MGPGAGTPLGDAAEARALSAVFRGAAVDPSRPPAAAVDCSVLAHAPELLATLTEVGLLPHHVVVSCTCGLTASAMVRLLMTCLLRLTGSWL